MSSVCPKQFLTCAKAIQRGALIQRVSPKDKEYHFQGWFEQRLQEAQIQFDEPKRNSYPDYTLVSTEEGFELKALA